MPTSHGDQIIDKLAIIERITRELFPGRVLVERLEDPEIENYVSFAFHICTALDLDSLAAKRYEWYDRTHQAIADDVQYIRLAVSFA